MTSKTELHAVQASSRSLSKAATAKNEAEVNAKVKDLGNNREGACGDLSKALSRACSQKLKRHD